MKHALFSLLISTLILTGCVSHTATKQTMISSINTGERASALKAIEEWSITGKIAFLQREKRESANIYWQVNQQTKQQALRLTTYLGINVLNLEQANGLTTIAIDDKSYQGQDIELLIYQLTGLILPADAIHYWIKGLPFLESDNIIYNINKLPLSLSSNYDNQHWTIDYQSYRTVNGHQLATKLTIKQAHLTIKLSINNWKF